MSWSKAFGFLCGFAFIFVVHLEDAQSQTIHTASPDDDVLISYNATGITTDENGIMHVCYVNNDENRLEVKSFDGTNWSTEVVDDDNQSGDSVGHFCEMLTDQNNHLHVVYYNTSDSDLRHAEKANDNWTIRTIDNNAPTDWALQEASRPSFKMAPNGHLGVSYFHSSNRDLLYAEWDGANWNSETVISEGNVGRFSALSFDNENQPHIVYMNYTSNSEASLYLISEEEGDWSEPVLIDDEDYSGAGNTINIDDDNQFHITFRRVDSSNYQSYHYKNNVGGEWNQTYELGSSSQFTNAGRYMQAALDEAGHLYLFYRYDTASALFGSSFSIKLTTLQFATHTASELITTSTKTVAISSGFKYNYTGLSLRISEDRQIVLSWAQENVDQDYELRVAEVTELPAAMKILTPNSTPAAAEDDQITITWIEDFSDAQQNHEIFFFYYDDSFQIQIITNAIAPGTNQVVLDTSSLTPGDFRFYSMILDENQVNVGGSVVPVDITVAERPVEEEQINNQENNQNDNQDDNNQGDQSNQGAEVDQQDNDNSNDSNSDNEEEIDDQDSDSADSDNQDSDSSSDSQTSSPNSLANAASGAASAGCQLQPGTTDSASGMSLFLIPLLSVMILRKRSEEKI